MKSADIRGYRYQNALPNSAHAFLVPTLRRLLDRECVGITDRRIFEVGCGNGSVADVLTDLGWDVTGVDPSSEGIAQARRAYPHLRLFEGSTEEDLVERFGKFPVVVSLEVVEHVFAPRRYAQVLFQLLQPDGVALLSTPYHGYLKNLALALSGRMDRHFTALWDCGHIKFWSMTTLGTLLKEAGFSRVEFTRVGRIPSLAKSMFAVAHK